MLMAVTVPQRGLHGVRVERVHYALHAFALQVAGLGIELDVVRVRNLFYEYKYFHSLSPSCCPGRPRAALFD